MIQQPTTRVDRGCLKFPAKEVAGWLQLDDRDRACVRCDHASPAGGVTACARGHYGGNPSGSDCQNCPSNTTGGLWPGAGLQRVAHTPLQVANFRLARFSIFDAAIRAARLAVCEGCEFAKRSGGAVAGCVACGCGASIMEGMARIDPRATPCPRNKWPTLQFNAP